MATSEREYPKRQITTLKDGDTLPAGWMVVRLLNTFDEAIMGSTSTQRKHVVVLENGYRKPIEPVGGDDD